MPETDLFFMGAMSSIIFTILEFKLSQRTSTESDAILSFDERAVTNNALVFSLIDRVLTGHRLDWVSGQVNISKNTQ